MIGICHICGVECELTFEHVPPKRAFNNKSLRVAYGPQLFEGRSFQDLKSNKERRGAGGYTLCGRCNNTTGDWYARDYVEWVKQAAELLERAPWAPTLYYPFWIYPLRVLKQIITMFFSINAPDFRKRVPYLEAFVLDKARKFLPTDIKVYAGYCGGDYSRSAGVSGILQVGSSAQSYVVSEIAFRPFVFLLSLDSASVDARLIDISPFSYCSYEEYRCVDLRLPVLPVYTAYPADFRSEQQVRAAAAEAKLVAGAKPRFEL